MVHHSTTHAKSNRSTPPTLSHTNHHSSIRIAKRLRERLLIKTALKAVSSISADVPLPKEIKQFIAENRHTREFASMLAKVRQNAPKNTLPNQLLYVTVTLLDSSPPAPATPTDKQKKLIIPLLNSLEAECPSSKETKKRIAAVQNYTKTHNQDPLYRYLFDTIRSVILDPSCKCSRFINQEALIETAVCHLHQITSLQNHTA